MGKKKEREPQSAEEIQVKLKPFLGIKPGVYLTVLYAVILLAVLFFLLVFPGLVHNGSEIVFTSRPEGAAVTVDGKYAGETPCTVFVSSGDHTLSISKPYYRSDSWSEDIPGKTFFSLFSPRRITFSRDLAIENVKGFVEWKQKELAQFSLAGKLYSSYQIPSLLSDTIESLVHTPGFNDTAVMEKWLLGSMGYVNNPVILRDFIKAASLVESEGGVLTASDFISLIQRYNRLQLDDTSVNFWVVHALPDDVREEVKGTTWYEKSAEAYERSLLLEQQSFEIPRGTPVTVAAIPFYRIPAGYYIQGLHASDNPVSSQFATEYHPHNRRIESFYMMAGEVTREQFARFIDANPYWEKGNKQELVDDNKVNDTYLENWDSLQQNQPVTHISFYAAEAFCAWLTEQLPPGLDNYYVRLPTEAEWEYVARTLWKESVPLFEERNIHAPLSIEEITAEAPGIKQLRGNLWEWCENWYFPADYLVPDSLDAGSVTGVEKAVRGGSWANREEEITPVIRGSQPPSWCTPFLGFRAILVEKAE